MTQLIYSGVCKAAHGDAGSALNNYTAILYVGIILLHIYSTKIIQLYSDTML